MVATYYLSVDTLYVVCRKVASEGLLGDVGCGGTFPLAGLVLEVFAEELA
jgi:hypothetical protein